MIKPISFKIAAWLYLFGMFIGLSRDFIYQTSQTKPEFVYWNPIVFSLILLSSFIGYYLISKGLNWVRIVSTILFAISLLSLGFKFDYLKEEFEYSILAGFLIIASYVLRGLSVYYQFHKDSNRFIKNVQRNRLMK